MNTEHQTSTPPCARRYRKPALSVAGVMLFAALLVYLSEAFVVIRCGGSQEAQNTARLLKQVVESFYALNDRLPVGLSELYHDSGMGRMLHGDLPVDPWDRPYLYTAMSVTQFEIRSLGPDGELYSWDDIVRPDYEPDAHVTAEDITQLVENFSARYGRLPLGLFELAYDGGLGPVIVDSVPKDPWGRLFLYTAGSVLTFEIRSLGADGELDSDDDIVQLGSLSSVPQRTIVGGGNETLLRAQ